jgi:hypothetical protein
MNYKNGYKVVYEIAADGKRTFYAAKSNEYPTRDEAGNITDDVLASFVDADFAGKTIYEYAGEFYVSTGAVPAYNKDGTPKDDKIKGFEKLFVEETSNEDTTSNKDEEEDKPVVEGNEPDGENEDPQSDLENDEPEVNE